jgi:predicted PurR-regulated permease PerM
MLGLDARAARAAWTVGLVILAFYVVYLVRKTLLVLVLALFLAYLIAPLVRLIERVNWRRLPRTVSVAEAFLLVVGLATLGVRAPGSVASDEARKLAEQLPKLTETTALGEKPSCRPGSSPTASASSAWLQQAIQDAAQVEIPLVKNVAADAVHFAGNLIFVALIPILAFMLREGRPADREALQRELRPMRRGRRSWASCRTCTSARDNTCARWACSASPR